VYWCQNCGKKYFTDNFSNWTSGNDDINELIRITQMKAKELTDHVEWIPYNELENINQIDKGGFGVVYSAIWKSGPLTMIRGKIERSSQIYEDLKQFFSNEGLDQFYDLIEKYEKELGPTIRNLGPCNVAIKVLKDNIMKRFLNELKAYIECASTVHASEFQQVISRCYGISQDPKTESYIFVMKLEQNGNLRQYLKKNFSKLKWYDDKLKLLISLANGLRSIHEAGLLHRDFNANNILIGYDNNAYIADLGLSCFEKDEQYKFNYGVLPFIAPEVLRRDKYIFASDIYSFGIIMWMLTSGQFPFVDNKNEFIELEIYKGKRPNIIEGTPECYRELMERCWNSDPSKRPSASDLYNTSKSWYLGNCYNQFKNADLFSALNSDQSDLSPGKMKIYMFFGSCFIYLLLTRFKKS
jgi:serine/threonine protein kinase